MASFKLDDLPPAMRAQALAQVAKQPNITYEFPHDGDPNGQPGTPGISGGNGWKWFSFCIMGKPIGKPRMTRCDKWKKRDCVMRYREWADLARDAASCSLTGAIRIDFKAYIPMPESWSQKKKVALRGKYHRQRPDLDNIEKALFDALFQEDREIACGFGEKFWDDGKGERIEVTVWIGN